MENSGSKFIYCEMEEVDGIDAYGLLYEGSAPLNPNGISRGPCDYLFPTSALFDKMSSTEGALSGVLFQGNHGENLLVIAADFSVYIELIYNKIDIDEKLSLDGNYDILDI